MIANVSVMGKGRISGTQALWSFLPISSQQEMRAAQGTISWWVDHCLPTGPELVEVDPTLLIAQKQGFKEDFLVLEDEQEGLCRPRNLVRQHIPAGKE